MMMSPGVHSRTFPAMARGVAHLYTLVGLSSLILGVESWLLLTTRGSASAPGVTARRARPLVMAVQEGGEGLSVSRRDLLGHSLGAMALLGGLALSPRISQAAEGTQEYTADKYPVKFGQIPANWVRTDTFVGGVSDRRTIVVYQEPTGVGQANVFIAYTPIRSDFSSTTSFGNVFDVAKTIVPKGRGVDSRLYTAESRKGYFFYDYEVQPDGQPKRHLQTIFAVLGEEEVLVTFTAQCLDEYFTTFKPTFEAITNSFTIKA